jgi:hypothetical protein
MQYLIDWPLIFAQRVKLLGLKVVAQICVRGSVVCLCDV